jgi:hypothetical protein
MMFDFQQLQKNFSSPINVLALTGEVQPAYLLDAGFIHPCAKAIGA